MAIVSPPAPKQHVKCNTCRSAYQSNTDSCLQASSSSWVGRRQEEEEIHSLLRTISMTTTTNPKACSTNASSPPDANDHPRQTTHNDNRPLTTTMRQLSAPSYHGTARLILDVATMSRRGIYGEQELTKRRKDDDETREVHSL